MGGRYRRWCFTLNNYDEETDWKTKFSEGGFARSVVGFEKGEEGTKHLQGYLEYRHPVRLATLKEFLSNAHWEAARDTAYSNHEYCSKDGNFFTTGEWKAILEAKGVRGVKITSKRVLSRLLVAEDQDIRNEGIYLYRKKQYDERLHELRSLQVMITRREEYIKYKLQNWQRKVLIRLFDQPRRKIMWCYDTAGGIGKSFLAHLLHFVYRYDLFDGVTTARDICNFISSDPRGFVLDVTRDNQRMFSYGTLEQLKNGFVMSGKYEGVKRMFPVVPVVVFANFYPETERLSGDRWDIHDFSKVTLCDADCELILPIPPPPVFPTFEEKDTSISSSENPSDISVKSSQDITLSQVEGFSEELLISQEEVIDDGGEKKEPVENQKSQDSMGMTRIEVAAEIHHHPQSCLNTSIDIYEKELDENVSQSATIELIEESDFFQILSNSSSSSITSTPSNQNS